MATIFGDPGGEYYFSLGLAAAITAGVWNNRGGGESLINNAAVGRAAASDGKIYAIHLGNSGGFVQRVFGSNYAHFITGCAMYMASTGFTNNQQVVATYDGTTIQTDLRTDGSGHLFFTRNGTQIGSTSTAVLLGGWNYIEIDVVYTTGATGSASCWLNGVQIINATSVQTAASGNAFANRISYIGPVNGVDLKDVYILDGATSPNTTHLGDITVAVKFPNAAGTNQAWTNNGGASQTASVQDGINHTGTWPDGDTTYISSATAGQISDFAHETLTLTGTIAAIIHASYLRKDDAGSRTVSQVCLSGATTEVGTGISLGGTYQYFFDFLDNDPNTSAAWTITNYNNATFGVKEIS